MLLIRDAFVDGRRVDVVIADGTIRAVTPSDGGTREAKRFDTVLDAGGGALIPGLHDHHIHLMALAAARESLVAEPGFADALRTAVWSTPGGGWIRVVGYHESIAGDLDRAWLDAVVPDRPVRVQHRSGAMWVLNSVALAAVGIDSDDGRLFRIDDDLRSRLPPSEPDLATVGAELAGHGVTGVSDLTPVARVDDLVHLAARVTRPSFPLRVMVTGAPSLDTSALAATGVAIGPAKVVVGDHELPTIDDLVAAFRMARRNRRPVAVHCVTRVGLILALAAWEEVGVIDGDRIEHAAVVPAEMIATIRDLGLTVVTQPSFACERGDDYLRDVDADDLESLWRCASLLDAGVAVGSSTDAPYGSPDPWRAIAAAAERTTLGGSPIGRDERVSADRALQMFLTSPRDPGGAPRRVAVGEPADLCLLDAPLAVVLAEPSSDRVVATVGRAGVTVRSGSPIVDKRDERS